MTRNGHHVEVRVTVTAHGALAALAVTRLCDSDRATDTDDHLKFKFPGPQRRRMAEKYRDKL